VRRRIYTAAFVPVVLMDPPVCMKHRKRSHSPYIWLPRPMQSSDGQQGLVRAQGDPQATPPLSSSTQIAGWSHRTLSLETILVSSTAWMAPLESAMALSDHGKVRASSLRTSKRSTSAARSQHCGTAAPISCRRYK